MVKSWNFSEDYDEMFKSCIYYFLFSELLFDGTNYEKVCLKQEIGKCQHQSKLEYWEIIGYSLCFFILFRI